MTDRAILLSLTILAAITGFFLLKAAQDIAGIEAMAQQFKSLSTLGYLIVAIALVSGSGFVFKSINR